MIRSSADTKGKITLKADAVVIGSGAGGALFAHALSERGVSVVVLEQGRHVPSHTFNQRELDMYESLYDSGARTGPADLSSSILFGRVLGGSSVHYMANSFRLPAFKRNQWRDWMGGEPLTGGLQEGKFPSLIKEGMAWADDALMNGLYEQVEAQFSVHDATEAEMNDNNKIFRRGTEALGWRGEPARHARKDCIGAGTCLIGCPFDKKQSQLVTTIPAMVQKGVPIFTDTEATGVILKGRPPAAVGVEAVVRNPETGRVVGKLTIHAERVFLAAGGVGSPVFWKKARLPDPYGLVGKNFQVTPHLFVFGEMEEVVNGTYGLPCSWVCHQFEEVKGGEGGYMIQGVFAQPGMVGSMMPGFGHRHRELMKLFSKGAALLSLLDDEEPGEVRVGPGGKPEIHYQLRGKDLPKARDFLRKASQLLLAAGAKRVVIPDVRMTTLASEKDLPLVEEVSLRPGDIPWVGTSCLGTLRMNADPKKGVVKLNNEAHGVRNLFVIDASWFPGSSAVDPSLTIMMNALRVAWLLYP